MEQAEKRSNDSLALRLQELEKENAMLKRILDQHGISYSVSVESSTIEQPTHIITDHTIRLSLQEKVAIFQNLFKGEGHYRTRLSGTRRIRLQKTGLPYTSPV